VPNTCQRHGGTNSPYVCDCPRPPRGLQATRAFAPHHPLIPVDYQLTGQPVLIGGTMGTCSYVLTGTEKGEPPALTLTMHSASKRRADNQAPASLRYRTPLAGYTRRHTHAHAHTPHAPGVRDHSHCSGVGRHGRREGASFLGHVVAVMRD